MHDEIERFLIQGQAIGWAESTLDNYRYLLGLAADVLVRRGCRRCADVGRADLEAFLADLAARRSRSTVLRASGLLRRFFTWLLDQGRILSDPTIGLPLPDDGEANLPDPPLSESEVAGIIDGLPRATVFHLRHVCLLELLYGCGLRISEAMALDLSDINLARGTVLIRESKHGQTRVVPLPRTARAALQTYLSLRRTLVRGPDTGAVFLTERGRRWSKVSVYGFFATLNERGGPDGRRLHPHLFRHSIAVHLLRGGADIRYIQAFLGHASLDTTKIYLRLVPGHLKEDYEKAMPEIAVGLDRASPDHQ